MRRVSNVRSALATAAVLTTTALTAAMLMPSSADAQAKKSMLRVTFANITNPTIKVTAYDLNDNERVIVRNEVLKHNEQISGQMVEGPKGGKVRYVAEMVETDSSKKKCKKYTGDQLSNGHTFSISADSSC